MTPVSSAGHGDDGRTRCDLRGNLPCPQNPDLEKKVLRAELDSSALPGCAPALGGFLPQLPYT